MIKTLKMTFFLTVLGMIFSGDLAYYFNHSESHILLHFIRSSTSIFFAHVLAYSSSLFPPVHTCPFPLESQPQHS